MGRRTCPGPCIVFRFPPEIFGGSARAPSASSHPLSRPLLSKGRPARPSIALACSLYHSRRISEAPISTEQGHHNSFCVATAKKRSWAKARRKGLFFLDPAPRSQDVSARLACRDRDGELITVVWMGSERDRRPEGAAGKDEFDPSPPPRPFLSHRSSRSGASPWTSTSVPPRTPATRPCSARPRCLRPTCARWRRT